MMTSNPVHKGLQVVTWLLFTGLCATVIATDDDAKTIESMLHRFLDGVSSGDRSVHEWFWDDELVYTSSFGQRFGKERILEPPDADAEGPPGRTPHYRAEDVDVRLHGQTAVLAFRLVAETPSNDGSPPSVVSFYNTGTLLKQSDRWTVIAWQATRIPEPDPP